MDDPAAPTPPLARRRPFEITWHDDTRIDDWSWLRDKDDPETIPYLEAENAYTEAMTAHTAGLRERLFEEFKSRIQETDLSAPVFHGGWWYYTKTFEGLQYSIHCRSATRPGADGSSPGEVVLLDENQMAEGLEYFALRARVPSPDHTLLVYAINTDGSDRDQIHVRDMRTGRDLDDVILDVSSNVVWASDNRTLFYVRYDAALRPHRLWRHELGTATEADALVMEEPDERFRLRIRRAKSGAYLIVSMSSPVTDEEHLLEADDPTGEFRLVEPRRHGVEYSLTHQRDRFFVVTNDGAPNFKLMQAPREDPSRANWTPALAENPLVRLYAVDAFAGHLVLHERANAVRRIRVMRTGDGTLHEVDQPEDVSTATPAANPEFETSTLRYGYTSLVTPNSIYDYDMDSRERVLVKQDPVLGGYEPANYTTFREWATANDGTKIPISIVCGAGTSRDGSAPALIYGYGSYESSTDPAFNAMRLSLLDRGFVYAIAHVRGGGEMGRHWYEQGKFLYKRNTFTDFVACARHLLDAGYTSADRLVALGGSAGGLLMGAVVNLAPELFCGVVAQVPFVDVVTTMLDETIPLTVPEFEEWGNPKEQEFYRYMKTYSPYDNVEAKNYPAMLVTTGINDTRVAFWEPAKWVAKLRVTKTDDRPLLLKTQLGAGHAGPSGRYNAWRETAFVYAFILSTVGIEA